MFSPVAGEQLAHDWLLLTVHFMLESTMKVFWPPFSSKEKLLSLRLKEGLKVAAFWVTMIVCLRLLSLSDLIVIAAVRLRLVSV